MSELVMEVKPRPMKYRALQVTKKNAAQVAAYLREYYAGKNITVKAGGGWVKAKFESANHDVPVEITATVSDWIVIGPYGHIEVLDSDGLWERFTAW